MMVWCDLLVILGVDPIPPKGHGLTENQSFETYHISMHKLLNVKLQNLTQ